jgi:membrane protease YdiL (CAAX protease family)
MSDGRKAALYLGLVFAVGWALMGLLAALGGLQNKVAFGLIANLLRLVPGAVALTIRQGITQEGWGDSGMRAGPWRLYALAYALPVGVVALGFLIASALGAGHLSLDVAELGEKGPLPQGQIGILIVSAFLLDPLVFLLLTTGEELGWRGYLLPKLLGLGVVPALLLQAALWGIWQAPLLILASERPQQALVEIGLTFLFALAAGTVWGILFLASRNILVPAVAAAVRDSMLGLFGFLFIAGAANYREVGGLIEIVLWALVAVVFLTPLPIFRRAAQRA